MNVTEALDIALSARQGSFFLQGQASRVLAKEVELLRADYQFLQKHQQEDIDQLTNSNEFKASTIRVRDETIKRLHYDIKLLRAENDHLKNSDELQASTIRLRDNTIGGLNFEINRLEDNRPKAGEEPALDRSEAADLINRQLQIIEMLIVAGSLKD